MGGYNGHDSRRNRAVVLALYGPHCHLCGRDITDLAELTADHLVPRSKGGSHAPANLRPAHRACNISRKDMPLNEWFRSRRAARPELPSSREW